MGEERKAIIDTINHPLGFFVLALLIIEAFLAMVLIFSDLEPDKKYIGMWLGLVLFLIVVGIVAILVWCKPKNLTFGEESHLKAAYGTDKGVNDEESPEIQRRTIG